MEKRIHINLPKSDWVESGKLLYSHLRMRILLRGGHNSASIDELLLRQKKGDYEVASRYN